MAEGGESSSGSSICAACLDGRPLCPAAEALLLFLCEIRSTGSKRGHSLKNHLDKAENHKDGLEPKCLPTEVF